MYIHKYSTINNQLSQEALVIFKGYLIKCGKEYWELNSYVLTTKLHLQDESGVVFFISSRFRDVGQLLLLEWQK